MKKYQNTFGVSLKSKHYLDALEKDQPVEWFEVHSENYMEEGGNNLRYLEEIRKSYELSLHGVSLSLGSAEEPNRLHLKNLKTVVDRFDPILVSEHISWSRLGDVYLNDLLPFPYTEESLENICHNIEITQDYLGRQILVENPSVYLKFKNSLISEPEFINQIVEKTGCGLLLDVNNIYVSGCNNGFDPTEYLSGLNQDIVGEIHVAGHSMVQKGDTSVLIDTHGSHVCDEVWDLYAQAINQFGPIPTLVEWDTDVPELDELVKEVMKAKEICEKELSRAAA